MLKRGYVRVSARPSGDTIVSAEAARAAGAVTLHFRDGPVDAKVERPGGKAYERPKDSERVKGAKPDQPSLL